MTERTRPIATLLVLALAIWIGWLVYRMETQDARHDRQLADCQLRASLERPYSTALYLCLTDRYHWEELEAAILRANAVQRELLERLLESRR